MIKRNTLIGTTALLAGIGMLGGDAALAASGNFCAWVDAGFKGGARCWQGNSADWPNDIDNKSSSWWNDGINTEPDEVVLYNYAGHGTPISCIPRGMAVYIDYAINDQPSSHRWVTSCPAINR